MLRIGLTGGIGAGKSTVATTFADCGAVIVDGDVISREVVEPGTEGLAALVDAFGDDILGPTGALNRPALAARAFVDDQQRARLNAIVHPLVARRRAELVAAVDDDDVVIEDIPLLVESGMAPLFPLVIVVHADTEVRLRRLVGQRGMPEADARARIAAQAGEQQRRVVADVWLDNSGSPGELVERARDLWHSRILPFAHNLAAGTPAADLSALVAADPDWPAQAARITARLRTACGHHAVRVDHIGSTAVTGMAARDVIDVQVTVASIEIADDLGEAIHAAGYPRVASITTDPAGPEASSPKRFHASADPGRPTHVHLRVDGTPAQSFALLFVDWLNASPAARADYLAAKRDASLDGVARWFAAAHPRARDWAQATGWVPAQLS
jgi:dephospho-CoA kinase